MNPKTLIEELIEQYGLNESNISVKPNGELALDLEGLQVMTSQLCTPLVNDELTIRPFVEDQKYFYCDSILTLDNGLTVKRTGLAMMGEELGEEVIGSIPQALSIAAGRAYRQSLRAIGFDPIRVHRQKARTLELVVEPEEQRRTNLRKQIHGIATDLGLIDGKDRDGYIKTMAAMYEGRISTKDLEEDEMLQFLTFLRAKKTARSRALALRVASEQKAA